MTNGEKLQADYFKQAQLGNGWFTYEFRPNPRVPSRPKLGYAEKIVKWNRASWLGGGIDGVQYPLIEECSAAYVSLCSEKNVLGLVGFAEASIMTSQQRDPEELDNLLLAITAAGHAYFCFHLACRYTDEGPHQARFGIGDFFLEVVDGEGIFRASGRHPSWVGRTIGNVFADIEHSLNSQAKYMEMIQDAAYSDDEWFSYFWQNKVNPQVQAMRTYVRPVLYQPAFQKAQIFFVMVHLMDEEQPPICDPFNSTLSAMQCGSNAHCASAFGELGFCDCDKGFRAVLTPLATACDGNYAKDYGLFCEEVIIMCSIGTELDPYDGVSCRTCRPGFSARMLAGSGMCDACVPGKIAVASTLAEPVTACTPCPPGSDTQLKSGQSVCIPCTPGLGTVKGSSNCQPCPAGFYTGGGVCLACDDAFQKLTSELGSALPTAGGGLQTLISEVGSDDFDDCTCAAGTYFIPKLQACHVCSERELRGLVCQGGVALPFVKEGYFARVLPYSAAYVRSKDNGIEYLTAKGQDSALEGFEILECQYKKAACPGNAATGNTNWRLVSECSDGLEMMAEYGVPCTRCADTYHKDVGSDGVYECFECTGGNLILVPLTLAAIGIMLVALYKGSKHSATQAATSTMLLGSLLSVVVNMLQTFSVISVFNIQIPAIMIPFFKILRVLLFDIELLKWECTAGYELGARYTMQMFVPLAPLCLLALTKLPQVNTPKLLNSLGVLYGVGYISLCRISFLPFECNADHPTVGLETMTHFPDSTCEEGEAITGVAVFGIVFYVFGILALYGGLAYVAPKKYRDETFRQSTGFLLNRWRPSSWYFQVIAMLRNLLISTVPVAYPTDGSMQLGWTAFITTAYVVTQSHSGPWRHGIVNVADAALSICIACICNFTLSIGATFGNKDLDVDSRVDAHGILVVVPFFTALLFPFAAWGAFFVNGRSPTLAKENAAGITYLSALTRLTEFLCDVDDASLIRLTSTYLTSKESSQLVSISTTMINEFLDERIEHVRLPRRLLFKAGEAQSTAAPGSFEDRRKAVPARCIRT